MIREVNRDSVEAVRDRRARRTPRFVIGPEHEMIDEQLRASAEEISERRFSFIGLEFVFLVDPYPGQRFRFLASSSLRRVRSFSALSSSTRAASHSCVFQFYGS
jgi:hypothetical protein